MRNTLKLMFLLIYSIGVFFIDNFLILGLVAIFNICMLFIYEVPKKKALYNIYTLGIFILFTMLLNGIFSGIIRAILIGIRLVLVCNMTYIFKYILSPIQISEAVENLLIPLKVFGINTKDIGLIINISLTFIPILSGRLVQIKYALASKGVSVKGWGFVKNIQYIFKPLFYNILKSTNELEYCIKAKGYKEV